MENKQKQIKDCNFCRKNATNLCYDCKLYFCEKCYKIIHELKQESQHTKENIDPFVPIDFNCPQHPDNQLNLYCVDEKGKLKFLLF